MDFFNEDLAPKVTPYQIAISFDRRILIPCSGKSLFFNKEEFYSDIKSLETMSEYLKSESTMIEILKNGYMSTSIYLPPDKKSDICKRKHYRMFFTHSFFIEKKQDFISLNETPAIYFPISIFEARNFIVLFSKYLEDLYKEVKHNELELEYLLSPNGKK